MATVWYDTVKLPYADGRIYGMVTRSDFWRILQLNLGRLNQDLLDWARFGQDWLESWLPFDLNQPS
jgi:hypothetical protein